jgi:hypothetical protein
VFFQKLPPCRNRSPRLVASFPPITNSVFDESYEPLSAQSIEEDAERFQIDLKERLAKFALSLHPGSEVCGDAASGIG